MSRAEVMGLMTLGLVILVTVIWRILVAFRKPEKDPHETLGIG